MISPVIIAVIAVGGVVLLILFGFIFRIWSQYFKRLQQDAERKAFRQNHTLNIRGNFVQCLSSPVENDYDLYIDQELGKGGCGVVVVAESTTSSEQFAIKIVNKNAIERGRLEREINLLKDVDHPNIIRLFRVYESDKAMYFVMELCAGGHLGQLIGRQNPKYLDESWAKILCRQLFSAVAHLNSRGIVHRDIKLQNILMDSSNDRNAQVKLIDFGYSARFVGNLPMRTKCGTPYTTAPEVLKECYDERCDVWSLGVVLYIMLSGKRPFEPLAIQGPLAEAAKTAMTTNILAGRYSMNQPAFASVSGEGLDLVKALLQRDYTNRMRAVDVLQHAWFTGNSSSSCSKANSLPSISPIAILKSHKGTAVAQTLVRMPTKSDLQKTGAAALAFGFQPRQAVDMRALFQSFDADASGALSPAEFSLAMKIILPALSDEDIAVIFRAIDINGDGQVTYTEFVAATLDPERLDIEELNKAFRLMDNDNNGYITEDELHKMFSVKNTIIKVAANPAPAVSATTPRKTTADQKSSKVGVSPRPGIAPAQAASIKLTKVTADSRGSHKVDDGNLSARSSKGDAPTDIDDRVAAVMDACDLDKDGQISYAEFLWAMTGAKEYLGGMRPEPVQKATYTAGSTAGRQSFVSPRQLPRPKPTTNTLPASQKADTFIVQDFDDADLELEEAAAAVRKPLANGKQRERESAPSSGGSVKSNRSAITQDSKSAGTGKGVIEMERTAPQPAAGHMVYAGRGSVGSNKTTAAAILTSQPKQPSKSAASKSLATVELEELEELSSSKMTTTMSMPDVQKGTSSPSVPKLNSVALFGALNDGDPTSSRPAAAPPNGWTVIDYLKAGSEVKDFSSSRSGDSRIADFSRAVLPSSMAAVVARQLSGKQKSVDMSTTPVPPCDGSPGGSKKGAGPVMDTLSRIVRGMSFRTTSDRRVCSSVDDFHDNSPVVLDARTRGPPLSSLQNERDLVEDFV